MKSHPDAIRQRIRDNHPTLAKDAKIGAFRSYSEDQSVKEQPNGAMIWMTATTDAIDLDNEVVVPGGADTKYFDQIGSIFIDHYYDADHFIGKKRSIEPIYTKGVQTGWKVGFYVPPLEKNPYAKDIILLAREKMLTSSIGYQPTDYGKPDPSEVMRYKDGDRVPKSIVREWDWLELSVTFFPCNMYAAQVGFSMAEEKEYADEVMAKRYEGLKSMMSKGLISDKTAKAFGLGRLQVPEPKRIIVQTPRRIIAA